LRVLHARSFRDDATRLWRNARTAAQASLTPDTQSRVWIEEGVRWLDRISGERIWAEFESLAETERVGRTVGLLDEWGVLAGTDSAWSLSPASASALRHRRSPGAEVLAGVLLAPLARPRPTLDRLRAPRAARDAVEGARRLLRASADADAGELDGLQDTTDAARIAAGWLGGAEQRRSHRELRRWERTRSPLDAAALMRLGVPQGPALGEWLRRLRRARYDGRLGDAAAARRLVRRELEELP
jgi:tRNA nucleotidyltransferase (CCA-adding enzyme)